MGDSGEGLVDAEARLQERMEESERERLRTNGPALKNPDGVRELESLRLARAELRRQLSATDHPVRRQQLTQAQAELDRRIEIVELSV